MGFTRKNKIKGFFFTALMGALVSSANALAIDVSSSSSPVTSQEVSSYAKEKVTIVGGGIIGVLNALFLALNAKQTGEKVRITIYEKNAKVIDTTSACIAPSLTTDEIASVIPPVDELLKALNTPFNEPGGIRVMDVAGIDTSASGQRFLAEVAVQGKDQAGIDARQKTLLQMGKMSMDLWVALYKKADPELRAIFKAANFRPCREPMKGEDPLAHGYRIDLLYGVENAVQRATSMAATYAGLGYQHCRLLSPEEVMKKDPTLSDFCETHSTLVNGKRQWKSNSVALLRPGGCINAHVFLSKIMPYLTKKMGTYVNAHGRVKPCFQFKLNRQVSAMETAIRLNQRVVTGVKFANGYRKKGNHAYTKTTYLLCPGEAIKMLENFGFKAPAYAGFAGASLILNIKVPKGKEAKYKAFVHCMEVHKPGVVLAWQAKSDGNYIVVAVAGTKAFYAAKTPHITEAFAVDRNLLQLNMINDVLPWVTSLALDRNTKGELLTQADMDYLVKTEKAIRWVGTRAVTFDGVPTVSHLYLSNGEKVKNGVVVTSLGSGGVSFGPAAAVMAYSLYGDSKNFSNQFNLDPTLTKTVLKYADSARVAGKVQ